MCNYGCQVFVRFFVSSGFFFLLTFFFPFYFFFFLVSFSLSFFFSSLFRFLSSFSLLSVQLLNVFLSFLFFFRCYFFSLFLPLFLFSFYPFPLFSTLSNLILLGHMDPLSTQIYSLFTLFDDFEWAQRSANELKTLIALYLKITNYTLLKYFAESVLGTKKQRESKRLEKEKKTK